MILVKDKDGLWSPKHLHDKVVFEHCTNGHNALNHDGIVHFSPVFLQHDILLEYEYD